MPYRLPKTTPVMTRPSLTIDRPGPFPPDEVVTVDAARPAAERRSRPRSRSSGSARPTDLRIVDGLRVPLRHAEAIRRRLAAQAVDDLGCALIARGCYLAITPTAKGYPEVARTRRFTVTPCSGDDLGGGGAVEHEAAVGLGVDDDRVAGLVSRPSAARARSGRRPRAAARASAAAPRSRGRSPSSRSTAAPRRVSSSPSPRAARRSASCSTWMSTMRSMSASVSRWNTTISSTRLRNSGLKWLRTAAITCCLVAARAEVATS